MVPKVSRICIVPARSGSKRIPSKNIRDFLGRPVIHYSLENALKSAVFDRIHVSTDDQEILNIAQSFGIEADFLRPASLADDYTTLFDVLAFVKNEFASRGAVFDEYWLLMPCAPLLEASDLRDAALKFRRSYGPMLSVGELPIPPHWVYIENVDDRLSLAEYGFHGNRSQDLKRGYYDCGAFAVFSLSDIEKGAFDGNHIQPYRLPRHKAVDIDTEDDWQFAEIMYEFSRKQNN